MTRGLFAAIAIVLFSIVKGIVKVVHIGFSSIYQNIGAVIDELRRDLKAWKQYRDEDI